jgi:hypothetical protein
MAKWLAMAAFAALMLVGQSAFAQQFSADMINNSNGATNRQKLYVADGKIRMESAEGKGIALISDPSHNTVYMLNAEQKIYVDMAAMSKLTALLEPENADDPCPQWRKLSGDQATGAWKCEKLGPDTLNGRKVVKYAGTSSKGETGNVWIDTHLKFVVKTEGPKASMELQNIKEGPQTASLFAVPAGYKQVDPKELMQAKPPG